MNKMYYDNCCTSTDFVVYRLPDDIVTQERTRQRGHAASTGTLALVRSSSLPHHTGGWIYVVTRIINDLASASTSAPSKNNRSQTAKHGGTEISSSLALFMCRLHSVTFLLFGISTPSF